jgi:hypothetical protein
MLNNYYQNELDELRRNNGLTDYILGKENQRRRINQEMELIDQERKQNEIKNYFINDAINKRHKMKEERRLVKYNLSIQNETRKQENNHFLEPRQIKDEKNLQLQKIENNHKLKIQELQMINNNIEEEKINQMERLKNNIKEKNYKYQLEKKRIENKHEKRIKNEEIKNIKRIKGIENNMDLIKKILNLKL